MTNSSEPQRRHRLNQYSRWALRLVCACLVGLFATRASWAAEASGTVDDQLQRIFAGAAPTTVAQLKAMERHQQRLAAELARTTVAVVVGPSHGSGVIISREGYVLTAAHVCVAPNRAAKVYLADGRKVRGTTLGLYRTLDAGLIKINESGPWPHADFADSDEVRAGQWCIACGHPGGFQDRRKPVIRVGRVLERDRYAITTDCTLESGDSGGPLFDMYGRVIGINSRIGREMTANLHVPVRAYKDTWERLVRADVWGSFLSVEPYIGVQGDRRADVARISRVYPRTPAEEAGIQSGDIIVRFNGQTVTDFASLRIHINDTQPGDKVPVVVRRGSRQHELKLVIGHRE